ncbi:hypothetical protein BDA96_03G326100 [Sorghum bicolor]|nr:hypothetical protein BDA96_03G326100 [Sorghum bicolor]
MGPCRQSLVYSLIASASQNFRLLIMHAWLDGQDNMHALAGPQPSSSSARRPSLCSTLLPCSCSTKGEGNMECKLPCTEF